MNWVCKVSVCNRRTNSRYKNLEKPWSWLKDRNRNPVRTTETAEEYPKLPKAERDALKDQGGFVGGWLKEGIRKNGNVLCRDIGSLDADNIPPDVDFPSLVREKLAGYEWFLYSTHRHTPEAPRYRLVIIFDREVSEDEYPALMRQVAHDLGMDYFDDSTYQANRMMYWASCPSNGEFVFEEAEGLPLPVDQVLARYENWRDTTQWPTSSRESEVVQKSASKQEDPLNKPGIVGAFCRTFFPVQSALEKFLPEVYAPTDHDGRWDYIPSDSTAGVAIYDDRFVYSHHTTDPACGKLMNAFDIVRIHKFGDDDSKKSFNAMAAFALAQDEVKMRLDAERRESIDADFLGYSAQNGNDQEPPADETAAAEPDPNWPAKLRYDPRSKKLENSVWNLLLILNNDPDFRNIALNELFGRIEVTGPVPWVRPEGNRFWQDADTNQVKALLDVRYTAFTNRNFEVAFGKTVADRRFHPIREYLDALPPWDGEKRIETLLPRCFQADDTPYVRAVTRKVFCAAVARIYRPGTKFDSVLVLDGEQGIGKSTLFRELAGDEYYSETLSLTDMSSKDGAEKLQGYWIVEIGELAGMRKADIEKVKNFISTLDDIYRPSYGHTVESHPRQAVIIATVNGEKGYLRDITGNRRFWIVKCGQTEQKKSFDISPQERDQIWAEALTLWKGGEKLWLEGELLREAEEIQRCAMEEDDRQGLVEAYLEMLLPLSWPDMDIYARRRWLSDPSDPTRQPGTVRRETVTNVEIWAECFGNDPAAMKKQDSYDIASIMMRIGGWDRSGKREHIPLYGLQRLYVRRGSGDRFLVNSPLLAPQKVPETPEPRDNVPATTPLLAPLKAPESHESCDNVSTNASLPAPLKAVEAPGPCDSVTTVTEIQETFYDFLL